MSQTAFRIRRTEIERKTSETEIALTFDLDGSGKTTITTGVPFFDHMLNALARHGGFDLSVTCTGDAAMDPHHTVEDVGIVLGLAVKDLLGKKGGIARYGHAYAPLDEALARVVIDCSGRPFLEFVATMPEQVIGVDFASSLIEEFWRAFVVNAALTCHIDLLRSRNTHHAAEAIFKAGALALRDATRITGDPTRIPSTKGTLA